ncbi:sodium/potassium-transporting ATPase subunit beta [Drosophila eugracilis]|uniref:sodium/potassium-transporting ATPase subunit beta n=1 Tax=Drosophila eugracilis TaxID=29029 RepID=UPI001BD9E893|nr:sodium/potassium-transporting ATPase subunit beta [Drosophila eugracilis]
MPNEAIIYSGPYEVGRLRRRRDRRVAEYLFRRSIRTSNPVPEMTPIRIAKLVLYFMAFSVVLAAFTAGMASILITYSIPPDIPGCRKFPGLSTMPGRSVGDQKQIVWCSENEKQLGAIRRQLSDMVEGYGIEGPKRMMGCNLDDSWGYASGKPCILMKLTQALGFEAITYNDAISLPDIAPDELYNYVSDLGMEERLNRIWVACQVKKEDDLDVMIDYVPERFFDAEALFTNMNIFLNDSSDNDGGTYTEDPSVRRIIGVQFKNIPPNRDVLVRCQVWAKNIPFHMGTARFLLHNTEPIHPTTPLLLDEWYEN